MSNLAIRHDEPMGDWAIMREQAKVLVASGFLPRTVNTPEKAIAIIQTGRELGLGPMQSLRSIHILDGKPTMAAELMAALVHSRLPGSTLRVAVTTNDTCSVEAGRLGQPMTVFTFTRQDAAEAQLLAKDNWKKYPAAMLRARAIAAAARAVFPDAVLGLYDADELGAVTTERGEVIELRELPRVTPHDDGDEPHTDDGTFAKLAELMAHADDLNAEVGESFERACELRAYLGSAAKQSELTKAIQAAKEARLITPDQHKELSKNWQRLNRACAKLEAELDPGSLGEHLPEPKP